MIGLLRGWCDRSGPYAPLGEIGDYDALVAWPSPPASAPRCGRSSRAARAPRAGRHLGELDLPADHRADRSGPGELQDPVPDVDTLCGREEVQAERTSRPGRVDEGEADSDQIEVAVDARLDRHRALFLFDARGEPDDQVAAVERHDPERLRRHGATHRVECHIDSPPVGDVVDEGDEVLGAVVHAVVGAQRSAELDLLVGSRRRDDRGAEGLGQLDRGRPGASGRGVDEDDVPGPNPSPDPQRQVAEQVREVHGDSLGRAEPRRGAVGGSAHRTGPPTRRHPALPRRHRRLDGREGLTPRSGRLDRSGGGHADDEGGLELQQPVPTADGVDVVEVEAERLHVDPHLVGARFADLHGLDLEGLGRRAQPGDHPCGRFRRRHREPP